MRCFEKVERKQGDWVNFRLFVKLMQESNFQLKVVFYFFISSLFHHCLFLFILICFLLNNYLQACCTASCKCLVPSPVKLRIRSFFVHAGLLPVLDVCSRSSHLSLTFFTHQYIRKLKKDNDEDENEAQIKQLEVLA